jgi:hypothetical protein
VNNAAAILATVAMRSSVLVSTLQFGPIARADQRAGADGAGHIVLIFEPHPDAVLASPYNAAWKPQPVFRDDQREFVGDAEKVGKLQCCAGAGNVAHNAWILVAAIVHLGGLHNFDPWRNPSFNHRYIPIENTSRVAWLY